MAPRSWARTKVVAVMVALTTAITLPHLTLAQDNTCDWMTDMNDTCVEQTSCSSTGNTVYIYEDCTVGSELFTVKDPGLLDEPCDLISSDTGTGKVVLVTNSFDAESTAGFLRCNNFILDQIVPSLYFSVINFNEFDPLPVSEGPIIQIESKENEPVGVLTTISYQDQDLGETQNLKSKLTTTEYSDTFELTGKYESDTEAGTEAMVFSLSNKKVLDFEEMMYYNLRFDIISEDSRGNQRTTEQRVFVAVQDVSDNPPTWIKYRASISLKEGFAGREVFTFEARDRDQGVLNDIQYSLEGSEAAYFNLDKNSGELTTAQNIDREALLDLNILDMTIEITATEFDKDGNPAVPDDTDTANFSTQVSVINILDINNKFPEFNQPSFEVTMNELSNTDFTLVLDITVTDMDEGSKGRYTISSNDPDHLDVSPVTGSLSTTLTVKTVYKKDDNIFDYEVKKDEVISFTLTATEDEDNTHIGTTEILITLVDVNDNKPSFTETNYVKDVEESTNVGDVLVTVQAMDGDVSEEFNTTSIVYSLELQCTSLDIDPLTGDVTLAAPLDYEEEAGREVVCMVFAKDSYGNGTVVLQSSSTITINVLDTVDDPPILTVQDLAIEEGSSEGETIGNVTVSDRDAGAEIEVTINWKASAAFKGDQEVTITEDMKKWIVVDPVEPTGEGEYQTALVVGPTSPDRETADRITLSIVAEDTATESGQRQDTDTLTVTIMDVNDEAPQFVSMCKDVAVTENLPANSTVCTLTILDPDEADTVTLEIDDDSLVDLEIYTIDTIDGEEVAINILVQEGADIDKEARDEFTFTVTLTDLQGHETPQEITIGVNDENDVTPILDPSVCDKTYDVTENEAEGYRVFTITADDGDATEPFNRVTLRLLNLNMPGDTNRIIPFTVNTNTGDVTVFLDNGKKVLDREQAASWELYFEADDSCEGYSNCLVRTSESCTVYVTVLDENDEEPRAFTWTPQDNKLEVDEFLQKGEIAGTPKEYEIWALDDDESGTPNSELTYTVLAVYQTAGEEDLELFKAVNDFTPGTDSDRPRYYCRLEATQTFYGQQLTGEYEIHLMAKDNGTIPLNGTAIIPLTIKDANDESPYFVFKGCLADNDGNITMTENFYEPNEDLMCDIGGEELRITVEDLDTDAPNNEVLKVEIDYDNSTAIVGEEASEGGQLRAFQIADKPGGGYRLYVTENINREQGFEYFLSLHVVDKGTPSLDGSAVIHVMVQNVFEHPPYFCEEGYCTLTLYMAENEPDVSASIPAATDLDNQGVPPDDSNYNKVYYEIIDGDRNDFELVDREQTKLILKDKPLGLDRETQSNYTLTIVTYNPEDAPGDGHDPTGNDTLLVTIQVQDKNDNVPHFDEDVIFASFTESDGKGKTIGVIQAMDSDLNETLTYTLGEDFEWHDTEIQPTYPPFSLGKTGDDNDNSATLLLNFEPTGINEGFCTFTINVEDLAGGKHSTQGKVYAITKEYQLSVYFYNDEPSIQSKQDYIKSAFSAAFDYECIIDSISKYEEAAASSQRINPITKEIPLAVADNTTDDTTTVVLMHFINRQEDTPVSVLEIVNALNNEQVANQLVNNLNLAGLNLASVQEPPTPTAGSITEEDTILTLKIIIAVVSLVLGLAVVLLGTMYCLRTRSLERRVKVLSTNTFGSQASGLDKAGIGKAPGSNMFTQEGANPIYNMEDTQIHHNDTGSISSGDSVLVGVEDNPEFRSAITNKNGSNNPAFHSTARSIDHVTAELPAALSGGPKINPLLELSDDHDLSDGLSGLELKLRQSSQSGSEEGSSPVPTNENFSFARF